MPNSVKVIVLATVILTLFSLILFLRILKRGSSKASSKRRGPPVNKRYTFAIKEIETAGEPSGVTRHTGGLLATASAYQGYDLSLSGDDVIYEQDGIPYINSDLAKKNQGNLDSNFVKLVESVTGSLPPPVPRQQDKPEKAHKGSKG
jgi:hypothetical protein